LYLCDTKEELLAMLLTHMPISIPQAFETMSQRLLAHFHNEVWDQKSNRAKYNYLAIHYHWYNRYTEHVSNSVLNVFYMLIFCREIMHQVMNIPVISEKQVLLMSTGLKEVHINPKRSQVTWRSTSLFLIALKISWSFSE